MPSTYCSCHPHIMSEKSKVLDVLSSARKVLWILGLYHGKQHPKYAFFEVRLVVTIVITVLVPALMLIKILLWKTNLATLLIQLSFFLLTGWVLVKTCLYVYTLPKQHALDDLLQDAIFNMQNRRQQRFISTARENQRRLVVSAVSIMTVLDSCFLLIPILCNNTTFNIPVWTPFNGEMEDIIISIFEFCSFIITGIAYLILDCNLIGITKIVTIQMQILKDNLERAADKDSQVDYARNERKIQERLRTCVIHHNAILDLARKVEGLFGPSLFFQIVFAVLVICFFGILITIETDRAQLIVWLLCFGAILTIMMVPCWCGQEFITESSGIIEACYMSEWYTCTPSTRKMYFIIMEQAKRPITLHGGPLFTFSYDTFVNILRSAYSYYAVFDHVYNK